MSKAIKETKEIRELGSAQVFDEILDAIRVDEVTEEYITFFFGVFESDEEVNVVAKIKVRPKSVASFASKFIDGAKWYEQDMGKKILPDIAKRPAQKKKVQKIE